MQAEGEAAQATPVKKTRVYSQCAHGRRKTRCRECGTGYCDHGNRKVRCKKCGTGLCSHGIYRDVCKQCKTRNYTCAHGKRKYDCKVCKKLIQQAFSAPETGEQYKQIKNDATESESQQQAEAQDDVYSELQSELQSEYQMESEVIAQWEPAEEAGPAAVPSMEQDEICTETRNIMRRCAHGRSKYDCKDCGTGRCEHGKRKRTCKDCGNSKCAHGKNKRRCMECGTGVCAHGAFVDSCRKCEKYTCTHGQNKYKCTECKKLKKEAAANAALRMEEEQMFTATKDAPATPEPELNFRVPTPPS